MTIKANHVDDQFSKFNCAQTVFSLFAPDLGIDEKTALKISSGFGSGMNCAETCGAVTGSYMVIGLKHGHCTSNPVEKAQTKQLIKNFNEKFKTEHGTLICRELTGFDISTPEGLTAASEAGVFQNKCVNFIKSACSIIENDF
jgi:C_GCAxxG_C_C family probable redox protein